MDSAGTWRLGRRPALDGLRGVAVLLVIAHHTGFVGTQSAAGDVGVTMFFALSGFLITSLLLAEREATGTIDLRGFYARRCRRLLPALMFFLAVVGVFGWVRWKTELWTLAYAANFPQATGGTLGGLSHTWSLALEEQFYLLWPVLLITLFRWGRAGVAWGAGIGAGLSAGTRLVLWAAGVEWPRLYFGSDTRADALLIGCLAAAVTLRPKVPGGFLLATAMALTAVSWNLQVTVVPTVAAVLTVGIISAPPKLLGGQALRYVGSRSYALYLWHFPLIFVVAPRLNVPRALGVVVVLLVAWATAEASWRLVERPFLPGPLRLGGGVVGGKAGVRERRRPEEKFVSL